MKGIKVVVKTTARNGQKMAVYHFMSYLAKSRKIYIFVFCVINFEPIDIWSCSTPQNDGLNFSFVKDIRVVVKKMARNC